MKCKVHPYEHGVGVCASCLRERLLALIAAQNEHSSNLHYSHQQDYHHHYQHHWSSDPPIPQPLVFPRSVSPYVSHRRSVALDASPARLRHHHFQRFFSTPQVGPTFDAANGYGSFDDVEGIRRRSSGRFSVLKILFGHNRSKVVESSLADSKASGSSSWFSALIRRKKKSQRCQAAADWAPPVRGRRSCRAVDKGMSPAMEDEDEEGGSGYSSDSSGGCRRPTPTPMRRFPANNYRHHRSIGAMSGFAVCLSPLVQVGPSGRRSQPMDVGFSGDLRSPANSVHHRQMPVGGPSLAQNRSRKLADFGRFK